MTAMPHDNAEFDTEFDLDVRLQAVARPDRAEKPGPEGTVTPMSCENTACRCD
jgi:hypothetical protein